MSEEETPMQWASCLLPRLLLSLALGFLVEGHPAGMSERTSRSLRAWANEGALPEPVLAPAPTVSNPSGATTRNEPAMRPAAARHSRVMGRLRECTVLVPSSFGDTLRARRAGGATGTQCRACAVARSCSSSGAG